MHRHGYQGRKFGRKNDQRDALIKSLAEALIVNESIETTLPKAKEIVPYVEKLITKAKRADLASRRIIITKLMTVASAHKLVDDIAPKLGGRNSGHLRIERTRLRRGDNAQLARVSFVDDLKAEVKTVKAAPAAEKSTTDSAKKPTAKKTATPAKKPAAKKSTTTAKKAPAKKTEAKK